MKVTPAGKFRTPIKFVTPADDRAIPSNTDDVTGEKITDGNLSIGAVYSDRAYMRTLNAREQLRARQVQADFTHIFVVRYNKRIEPTWRIVWRDGRRYHCAHISGITETVPGREMEITATEVTSTINYGMVWK